MKSRWIINLLLLLAIAILSLIAHFEPGIDQPAESSAITPLAADAVHRIHLNRPIRDDLVLIKRGTRWEIEGPSPLPADELKVRTLARLAEQIPVRSYAAADMDLSALQLAPPYATAVLNDVAIEFGNLEPIDDLRYVRVADQVHLIPDNHLQLMETGFSQFVRPRLFADNASIVSIRLPDMRIARTDGEWTADPASGLDSETLKTFVAAWQAARALYVQTGDGNTDGEAINIVLEGSDNPVQLIVLSREPDLILGRPDYGVQYRMAASAAELLSPQTSEAEADDP